MTIKNLSHLANNILYFSEDQLNNNLQIIVRKLTKKRKRTDDGKSREEEHHDDHLNAPMHLLQSDFVFFFT